jgi:hypothetical protein
MTEIASTESSALAAIERAWVAVRDASTVAPKRITAEAVGHMYSALHYARRAGSDSELWTLADSSLRDANNLISEAKHAGYCGHPAWLAITDADNAVFAAINCTYRILAPEAAAEMDQLIAKANGQGGSR